MLLWIASRLLRFGEAVVLLFTAASVLSAQPAARVVADSQAARSRALPILKSAAASTRLAAGVDETVAMRTPATDSADAEPASEQYRLLKVALGTYRARAANNPDDDTQVEHIVATLARQRVQPVPDVESGVVVNIAAFRLQVMDGTSDSAALAMAVIVGVPGRFSTPEMTDSIQYLVFAPYWEVPTSIFREELLAIARRDPHLLEVNNYQILDSRGRLLPATRASVKRLAAGTARLRQLPGGTNSLGRVKFMFPNAQDIYLHDTPHSAGFSRARRDASHGCVRVADPLALARFLLRDQPAWTSDRIEQAMSGKLPTVVRLTRPVPIQLRYATAVARADGSVEFFDDVYGLDTRRALTP